MGAERYEVIVVGGGPAGAAAACTLASAGRQVCLVDKAQFPRDKLCGGGLTFRGKWAFERAFRRRWRPDIFNASQNVAFYARGRFLATFRSGTKIHFMMRTAFDDYLLALARDAGATVMLGDGVASIDVARRTLTLKSGREIGFDFLIGADGVNSLVAKTLYGRAFDPAQIAFALEAEVPRDKLPDQGDLVEFDFSAARWGYGWVFPKQQTVTIGIGGMHRLNPDLRDKLARYLRGKGLNADDFKVKGQFLPAGDYLRVPGRGNVLLCGDAAGAVDPISGEGIPYAIATGAAAGRAVARALIEPQGRGAIDLYTAEYSGIVAPFDRAKFWRWFIYAPVVQRLFAWAFRFEPVRNRILRAD